MKLPVLAIYCGGAIQLSVLFASALAPAALNWRQHLEGLPKLLCQMFWVYGGFIVFMIVSFAVLSFLHAETLAAGEPVARSLCALIAGFWGLRLIVQFFVFDAKPWLTRPLYRYGYHALTCAFVTLVLIYGNAALRIVG